MSMKFVALAALMLAACGPVSGNGFDGDPTELAIEVFTAEHGAPSAACADRARGMVVQYMGAGDVQAACGKPTGCVDQYDAQGAIAVIRDGSGAEVVAHEALHVLLWCELNVYHGDTEHSDATWHDARVW